MRSGPRHVAEEEVAVTRPGLEILLAGFVICYCDIVGESVTARVPKCKEINLLYRAGL